MKKNRPPRSQKILIGTEGENSIGEYLGVSRSTVNKYVKELRLPVRVIFNRLFAHTENIDDFFKQLTRGGRQIGKNSDDRD